MSLHIFASRSTTSSMDSTRRLDWTHHLKDNKWKYKTNGTLRTDQNNQKDSNRKKCNITNMPDHSTEQFGTITNTDEHLNEQSGKRVMPEQGVQASIKPNGRYAPI
jgi:hypothetical protein